MRLHTVANGLFVGGVFLGGYLVYLIASFRYPDFANEIIKDEMLINNAEIESLDKDNNISKISADMLTQNDGIISAKNMRAELQLSDGKIFIYSDFAVGNREKCDFPNRVKIEFADNGLIKASRANVNMIDKRIHMMDSVSLESNGIKISSNICNANLLDNKVEFMGNVRFKDKAVRIASKSLDIKYCGSLDRSNFRKGVLGIERIIFLRDIIANYRNYKLTTNGNLIFDNGNLMAIGDVKVVGSERGRKFELRTTELTSKLTPDKKIDKLFCKKYFVFRSNGNTISGKDGVFFKNKVIINQNIHIISDSGELFGKSGEYDFGTGKASIDSPSGLFFNK